MCCVSWLKNYRRRIWPNGLPEQQVLLGDGVLAALMKYNKVFNYDLLDASLDHRLWAYYGRQPTTLIKVATILAAFDWAESSERVPVIELSHLARAQGILESWRASTHRALSQASMTHIVDIQEKIQEEIQHNMPSGITMRDLRRSISSLSSVDIESTSRSYACF